MYATWILPEENAKALENTAVSARDVDGGSTSSWAGFSFAFRAFSRILRLVFKLGGLWHSLGQAFAETSIIGVRHGRILVSG